MRKRFRAATLALLAASMLAAPVLAQTIVGPDAARIVAQGQIRATSAAPYEGFILLIEFSGKNYVCAVAARGKVQYCDPLQW